MADYTIVNLREVEDSAPKFGMQGLEAHFAREALELQNQGVSLFVIDPDHRLPFGHRHKRQEEVYVVVAGSAKMKLDDEVVELKTFDAVRLPPELARGLQAGPQGATVIAVGAPKVERGDAEPLPDFWPA